MKNKWLSLLLIGCILTTATACSRAAKTESNILSSEEETSCSDSSITDDLNSSDVEDESLTSTTENSQPNSQIFSSTKNPTSPSQTNTTISVKKAVSKISYSSTLTGLPGTKSKELLQNPNRGFRLELTLNPSNGQIISGGKDAISYLKEQLSYYSEEPPQLAQNYIYLTDYSGKDLDQKAFDNLQKYFDALKECKVQSMVRIAYEYDESNNTVGPTTDQMLRHMKQLKPFLEKNKDGIHVIQAGFIGLWGEWHHSVYPHDQKAVLEGIVDMAPEGKMVQVRLASYKNVLDANDPRRSRVSYHDDYLVGVDHAWSTANPSNASEYQMMLTESANMLVDGEMPWGSDKYFNNGVIDGLQMAQHLLRFHFSTMSVVHNYKEGSMYANYNMAQWKSIQVDEAYLKSNGLRYSPAWLKDANGSNTSRSLFAYIRDYLGYYIAASNVTANVSGKSVQVGVHLQNYGFSAPYGMQKIELVLTDANNTVIASQTACSLKDLQPDQDVNVSKTLTAPEVYAGYKVGIRFVNAAGTPAKLANDMEYINGINTLVVLE